MGAARICLDANLPLSKEVIHMANYLGTSRAETIGLLVIVWSWFAQNTDDGEADLGVQQLADALGISNMVFYGMAKFGMLKIDGGVMKLLMWDRIAGEKKKEINKAKESYDNMPLFSRRCESGIDEAISKIQEAWNSIPGVVKIKNWSDKRITALRARLKDEKWLPNAIKAMEIIKSGKTPFLTGDNDRKWVANIDWFLRPDSVMRVLEGYYASGTTSPGQRHPGQQRDW